MTEHFFTRLMWLNACIISIHLLCIFHNSSHQCVRMEVSVRQHWENNYCFLCMNKVSTISCPRLIMSLGDTVKNKPCSIHEASQLLYSCIYCRAWHVVLHRLQHMQLLRWRDHMQEEAVWSDLTGGSGPCIYQSALQLSTTPCPSLRAQW